jgi:hypothetical protein
MAHAAKNVAAFLCVAALIAAAAAAEVPGAALRTHCLPPFPPAALCCGASCRFVPIKRLKSAAKSPFQTHFNVFESLKVILPA